MADLVKASPVTTEADKSYVRSEFVRLCDLCDAHGKEIATIRREICSGSRPRPSYVFDDGTEFVPADYFAQELRRQRFFERLQIRSQAFGSRLSSAECEAIWNDYLDGSYGKCLVHVSPESIVEKGYLVDQISALTTAPRELDPQWSRTLAAHVAALDAIERPFCDHDRAQAGGSVSRDTFITRVRAAYGV